MNHSQIENFLTSKFENGHLKTMKIIYLPFKKF